MMFYNNMFTEMKLWHFSLYNNDLDIAAVSEPHNSGIGNSYTDASYTSADMSVRCSRISS